MFKYQFTQVNTAISGDYYQVSFDNGYDKDDEPYLLEVNTVPGLTKESILPQQAAAAGISMPDLFSNAIEEAMKN